MGFQILGTDHLGAMLLPDNPAFPASPDCALCDHPKSDHYPLRCRAWVFYETGGELTDVDQCDCPGYEPDQEDN